jgi:hypothetical protein
MEASEINEFSKQMKEAGESSMTYVSLIISVLAVLVAMVTVLGHRTHTEATLMQTRAGDKWNEYQARKMRSEQILVTSDLLSLQPSSNTEAVQKKLEQYKSQLEKWSDELKEASDQAKEYEAEVDIAERKAERFDLGEALLQIAVILASITLLTRRSIYVLTAAFIGLGGLLVAASAFLIK